MATYSAIKGLEIQSLSADPANPIKGQVWYNSTSGTLKVYNGTSTLTITTST
jgi:hypothetical protein